ncbi:MAG: peptidase [Alphaproteobacteria bacterium]|nr:peptidase [Alphaproteobacteria bacterium]
MRFPGFAISASLLLATAASAAQPTFSADRFKGHVAFLADDSLEGRDTGSRGHEVAAAYVASQFLGLGLRPAGTDGGWYQQVPLRSAMLEGVPSLTISGPGGSKSWSNGSEFVARPSLTEQAQDVSAPVVFVGYGIDDEAAGPSDYAGLDVRGKIVAVLGGMPEGLPSEISAHLGSQKEAVAALHGAIGVVTVPTAQYARVRPFAQMRDYGGRPVMQWLGPDGRVLDEAPGVRATALLNDPAASLLFAGAPRSFAQVEAEAARPQARPKGFALATTVRLKRRSSWTRITSPEVIGLLPGSDPKLAGEYVVLMGHLDHLGIKRDAKPGDDRIYNGALDNAAGVATMLEAARAFVESGERPRRSILFIANTGEEKGLLGADYFANHPTVPIASIASVVDLDMPLLLYDFTDVIAFGADHSTLARTVARAAGKMDLKMSPDPMPEQSIFTRSDHYQFVRQGVPAVFLATGFANGGAEKWAQFLNGAYHHVQDDMSQPINWEAGARFAKLNYLISRDLADADQRPLWYQGDYFGNLFAAKAKRADRPAGAAAN